MISVQQMTEPAFEREERGPTRTCVGCRTRAPKEELVRLALPSLSDAFEAGADVGLPEIAVDLAGRLPGRGVHLHPTRACVTGAFKRGGLAQALKRAPKTTPDALRTALATRFVERIVVLLGAAQRAGKLAVGADAVREAMGSGSIALLVLASDAEQSDELMASIARLEGRARVAGQAWGETGLSFGSKGALGRMFGRDEVAVLGVLDSGLADHVAHAMDVASEMTEAR
jgi:hypothetical protein